MQDVSDPSEAMIPDDFSRRRIIAALGTGCACFLLYVFTLARLPLPGDSVNNLLLLLRLAPVDTFRNPLWFLLGQGVLRISVAAPLVLIHGMNAMLGASSVGLLFWIMAGVQHNRTSEEKIRNVRPLWPQFISGFVAAAVLALCTPFWFASVRAYPQTLHVLLVLLLVLLLLIYRERGRFSWGLLFAFLYGLSLVESSVLILLSPLFLPALLIMLWHHGHFRVLHLVFLFLAFLAGTSLVLLHAWAFMGTSTYVWREFHGYGHLLGVLLKDHYLFAMRGVPRVGWLTIGLFSVLPWLLIVPFPRTNSMKRKSFLSSYLLALLFTGFGILVLANHAITPWAQFGLMPLVVLPYLFLASWMGYLAGYWYILAARPRKALSREHSVRRRVVRRLYLCGLTAALFLLAMQSYMHTEDRHAGVAMGLARDIVASLDGREWLVTNGAIDGLILYAAFEAGVPLTLLNLGMAQAPLHRKYTSLRLSEPRLKSLAMFGLGPLLDEWMGRHDSVVNELAVLTHADLWQGKGLAAIPFGALFLAFPQGGAPTSSELSGMAMPLLDNMTERVEWAGSAPKPLPEINAWVFSHYSKIANNLGVFCEDEGDQDAALSLYQKALELNSANISALLNAFSITEEWNTQEAVEIAARMRVMERDLDAGIQAWGLSYHHGYVRHPMAYLQMGWSWAMTGKAGAAIQDLERAAALSGTESHLQMVLAALYFRDGRLEESEQAYYSMLAKNPDNTTAILGLARLAMRQGQYDQARGYLARLLELGVPADIVEFELASLEILMGNLPQATIILERLADKYQDHLRAPAILALIALDQGDEDSLARYVDRLGKAKEDSPGVKLVLALVSLRNGETARARQYLEEVIAAKPDHIQAMEMLVKLDMGFGRVSDAENTIRRIFSIDAGNAFANLALGSLQYVSGDFEMAESSFLASIERQPTSDALNSLAWVYMALGRHSDAQRYSAGAVRADSRNALAWDTLGESSLYLGDLVLAERALVRASELMPDSPRIIFHLAQLHEAKGDFTQARKLAESLSRHGPQLPADLYEDVLRFSLRLK